MVLVDPVNLRKYLDKKSFFLYLFLDFCDWLEGLLRMDRSRNEDGSQKEK
jgi:hypothetical protein